MKWHDGPSYLRRVIGAPAADLTPEHVDAQWRALVFAVVGIAFLLRLLYAAQVELLPEETYYWNYSRHLDIGYLDHPPLVAWLIWAGTAVFGATEFGVRCGALCCGVIASLFAFRLTRNLFGERCALAALLFAQVLPFFFLSATLMTPDAPLTAAWAASLYYLERALVGESSRAWMFAGLSLGLGLLSKYTIGLVGLSAFLFMVVDPHSRRWFRRWEPYAAMLIAAVIFAPVIYWNAQHDWASFAFQTSRRLADRPQFSLHKLIIGAMILITPTGLLAAGAAVAARRRPFAALFGTACTRAWRFLTVSLVVPLTVFALFSLRHEVKLDWTGAPWVAALPMMAFGVAWPETGGRLARWLRAAWPPTLAVLLLAYSVGLYHLVLGIPGVGYTSHMELVPVGWHDFSRQIDGIADDARTKYGDRILVVGMDRYAIASELAFYSDDKVRSVAQTSTAHLFGGTGLMYEQWFPAERQAGRTLLLVSWDRESLAARRLQPYADAVDPIREGTVLRDGGNPRRYYFRIVHGYHGAGDGAGAGGR